MKLINFMLAVVVMMHWTACAWNISPQIDAAEENWLDDMDMVPGSGTPGSSVFMRYALSFEFGMMTMVIGYGKIEPVSASEQIMGILILLINGSLYGYVIGEVCGIVEGMDPATQYFREHMDLLNGFMSEIGFPVLKRDRFRECVAARLRRTASLASASPSATATSPANAGSFPTRKIAFAMNSTASF